ncbi:clotting factor C-like [Cylas formicarius]|uniref:clotting factor C-like n=1 Tax=Cylas formicarius TaxID=197179 RepID=UPI0029585AF7|nr:clotting factor C-like [Cylas formicarius]
MMKDLSVICLLVAFAAGIVDCQNSPALPQSPCPEVFRYESLDSANNLWTGSLVARTPHVLHGLWIRLIFNKPVDQITVGDGFEAVPFDDKREYLIKNRDLLLRGNRPKILKFTVKYAGGEAPELIEYRLNAVTVCPNQFANRTDFYPNDSAASKSDYLQSITSEQEDSQPQGACGEATASNGIPDVFPWQAAVFTKLGNEENYTCEAILASDKFLITAAHCVTYLTTRIPLVPERLVVYIGRNNIDQRNSEPLLVSRIILYPGYQPENLLNDLALLEIKEPAKLNERISPVCLPVQNNANESEEVLPGYQLENGKFTKLSSQKIRKIPQEECFKDAKNLKSFLGDNNYCASYIEGNGACIGDSGSGSISLSNGKWQLKGILSLSAALQNANQDKCDASRNIVLTEISRYSQWLRRNIA